MNSEKMAELERLASMQQKGLLSKDEFEAQKKKLLEAPDAPSSASFNIPPEALEIPKKILGKLFKLVSQNIWKTAILFLLFLIWLELHSISSAMPDFFHLLDGIRTSLRGY